MPEVITKADLAEVRRSIRESSREVEETYLADMERVDVGPKRMAAPEHLVSKQNWLSGRREYISAQAADYDWFYGLSREEQARLRENWFGNSPDAQAPDEVFQKMSQQDWLAHTQVVDASRALASGRAGDFNPKRYGGLNLNSLIIDQPYDVRKVWSSDEEEARRHIAKAQAKGGQGQDWRERFWGSPPDNSRCQFFTDERGVVHPIQRTCGSAEPTVKEYDPFFDEEF